MPLGDGTGPMGYGPMTGRAAGYCAGYGMPGYMNPVPGRGAWGWARGLGRGRGRGWAYGGWAPAYYGAPAYAAAPWGWAAPTQQQQRQLLEQQAEALRNQLEVIQKRLDELSEKEEDQENGQ